jgi:hypothetical protein
VFVDVRRDSPVPAFRALTVAAASTAPLGWVTLPLAERYKARATASAGSSANNRPVTRVTGNGRLRPRQNTKPLPPSPNIGCGLFIHPSGLKNKGKKAAAGESASCFQATLCEALLTSRSPHLENITFDVLLALRESRPSRPCDRGLKLISRALMALGITDQLIEPGQVLGHGGRHGDVTEGVAPGWISFVRRWRETSTLQYVTRREIYYDILKAGRWATKTRPGEASPEHWTRQTAIDWVAEVSRSVVGQWANGVRGHPRKGKPLLPRARAGMLSLGMDTQAFRSWHLLCHSSEHEVLDWTGSPRDCRRHLGEGWRAFRILAAARVRRSSGGPESARSLATSISASQA